LLWTGVIVKTGVTCEDWAWVREENAKVARRLSTIHCTTGREFFTARSLKPLGLLGGR